MARVKPHIHRYVRVRTPNSSNYIWKCSEGDCNFFVYKAQENIIEGRASFCWNCGEMFQMDKDAMREDLPHCTNCRAEPGESGSPSDLLDTLSRKNQ